MSTKRGVRRKASGRMLLAIVLAASMVAVGAPASIAATVNEQISAQTASTIFERRLEDGAKEQNSKLDSELRQVIEATNRAEQSDTKAFISRGESEVRDGQVTVIVESVAGSVPTAKDAISEVGGRADSAYEDLIRAVVPVNSLEALAASDAVLRVRLPYKPALLPDESEVVDTIEEMEGFFTLPESAPTIGANSEIDAVDPAGSVSPMSNVFSHGFEDAGPWTYYSPSGPTWGRTTHRASAGSYSAYCAESSIAAPGPYANDMYAWMWAGPFDLSDATNGYLTYDLWLDSETGLDGVLALLSHDGANWFGTGWTGDTDGWVQKEVDIKDAGGEDFSGDDSVWIAFIFQSDSSNTAEGAYIDEVSLDKNVPPKTSEGVEETNASTAHTNGYTGEGEKVGIIDAGFYGYENLLGFELPDSVVTWGAGSLGAEGNGSEIHGTAVAETVHDMAPDATLYLAQVVDDVDVGNAAEWMVSQGVDVINYSMGSTGVSPLDGTGSKNTMVSNIVADGVFWANAAGNERQCHWMGDFSDANANSFLEWDSGDEIQTFVAGAGWPVDGRLTWDDSWTAAEQDYDLLLVKWSGSAWETIAVSENWQDGTSGKTPQEGISGTVSASGLYGWAVHRFSATRTDVDFDFFDGAQDLEFQVHGRSLVSPADNPSSGFMASGAIGRSPEFAQEDYSSEGPTRDGRLGVEIASPSDTANRTYLGTFPGTSASSPHLAGAAALVLDANPDFTPDEVELFLESNAVDLGAAGEDSVFGHGRLWLPDSMEVVGPYHPVAVAGATRYDTAVEVSKQSFPSGADTVIIATGRNWPDALGGAALAGAYDAPILLCSATSLPGSAASEVGRLGAKNAFILGGTGAVGAGVVSGLVSAGVPSGNITRLGGANRYQTAELVAQAAIAKLEAGAGYGGTAFVVTGRNFPDALAGSPLAAANGWPIYLSNPAAAPSELTGQMNSDGVKDAIILGGTGVVSSACETNLSAGLSGDVSRLAGANRYATGVAIASYGVNEAGCAWNGLAVATGSNFPDALSGGVLCAKEGSVMLLTSGTSLTGCVADCLTSNKEDIGTVYFLGGTGAVSDTVRNQIGGILQ